MHKIKNNPISNDDAVNKKYVDDNTTTKQDKTDNTLNTTDKTVIGAINELNKNFMKSITFNDTNLTITYKNGKVTTVPLNDFISGIIAKANLFSMVVVDALPTVADNGDGTYTITYVQSGTSKTTNNENVWFLYDVNGTYKETMFVGTTEITRDAGSIDLSNYVNKLVDVISTWDFTDLTKIPTMASLKNGITTTIDSSSTDTQVPSAKSVWDNMKNKNTMQPSGTMAKYSTVFDWAVNNAGATCPYEGNNLADCPLGNTWGTLVCIGTKTENGLKVLACSNFNDIIYIRTILRRNGTNEWVEPKWQRVCTTSVDDVDKTAITFTNTTNYKNYDSNNFFSHYYVQNGICYMSVYLTCVAPNPSSHTLITSAIPKPKYSVRKIVPAWETTNFNSNCINFCIDDTSTSAFIIGGTAGEKYLLQFSYPVSES